MNKHNSVNTGLVPFPVVKMAAGGNTEAMNAVLMHYEGYIAALSTKWLYGESGIPHSCVDEEFRRRLETKIITKILTFKLV